MKEYFALIEKTLGVLRATPSVEPGECPSLHKSIEEYSKKDSLMQAEAN